MDTSAERNLTVNENATVSFACSLQSNPMLELVWLRADTITTTSTTTSNREIPRRLGHSVDVRIDRLNGVRTATLHIARASRQHAGTYVCAVVGQLSLSISYQLAVNCESA